MPMNPEVTKMNPRDLQRVPIVPETASITRPATPEVRAIVAERRERAWMAQEYRELANEMLTIARQARSAQLRALPKEE